MDTLMQKIKDTQLLDLSLILSVSALFYIILSIYLPLQTKFEVMSLLITQNLLRSHHWVIPSINGAKILSQAPLYYFIATIWSKIFSFNDTILRLFSTLCALINITLIYLLMRYILTRTAAILSAAILATSFIFTSVAVLASPAQFNLLLFSCVLYSLIGLIYCKTDTVKLFNLCFWLFLALLTLSAGVYLTVLILTIIVIWHLFLNNNTIKKLHTIRGYFLFFAITIAWLTYTSLHSPHFLKFYFITLPLHQWNLLKINHYIPNWSALFALLLGFMPWIIFIVNATWYNLPTSWRNRDQEPLGLLLTITPITLCLAIIYSNVNFYWVILSIPALTILCARYLAPAMTLKQLPLKNNAVEILFLSIIIITAFIVSRIVVNFEFQAWIQNTFYQYMIGYIILSAMIALLILRYASPKKGIITLLVLTLITDLIGGIVLNYHEQKKDAASIAQYILMHKKTGDIIAGYYNYPYLSALHMNQNIVMINWQDMPIYANNYQTANHWLTDQQTFWEILSKNHKKAYIIVPRTKLNAVSMLNNHLKTIKVTDTQILMSN